jgi:hypothetical protein
MSSDDRTPRWVPGWRSVGHGSSVTFRCCDCEQARQPLGRKRTLTGWRCALCVRAKDAQKVQA